MAIDQLKGAAGVEFITKDLSAYSTGDDNSFKVGLVGWTSQGPSNQIVSISDTTNLYSIFGTPTKTAKNNQLLYAAKMLLDSGAILKIVREVEADEHLDAVAIMFPDLNSSILDYDTVLDGGFSGGFSGTNTYTGVYDPGDASIYSAISNSISKVVDDLEKNVVITEYSDPNSPFTLATKYPGLSGYYVTIQTYSYFNSTDENPNGFVSGVRESNIDTLTSRSIDDDVELSEYITGEGYYDTSKDRFFPNEDYTFLDDNDVEITVKGVFKRWDSDLLVWDINDDLTKLIQVIGLLRIYSSKTSTTPVQTIPFARINYVTNTGLQLKLDEATSSDSLVLGQMNEDFRGTWIGRESYTMAKAATTSSSVTKYTTTQNKILLKGGTTVAPLTVPNYDYGWGLFKDISNVKVNLLCASGTTVSGFGDKIELVEQVNSNVIVSMLQVCTIRKDCIAIFDLPKRKSVDKLIDLCNQNVTGVGYESGGSNASYESYWGAMYDGRQVMYDRYNKKDVEVAMTSFVACNITNVWTNLYPWSIVAGTNRGSIGYPSSGNVYLRYYPDEVGALSKERINTTRSLNGQFIWGEATLQIKNTSLNRLHAVSLLAYLYGVLRTKLTPYVYELNTSDLRKTITEEVTTVLAFIKTHDGLYNYVVTCNDSNNTSAVIDNNQLIVDIGMEITKGAERITVRNTVYKTNGLIEAGLI